MSLPKFDILKALEEASSSSELVCGIKSAKKRAALLGAKPALLRKAGFKPLTPAQIKTLKVQGNTAQDWKEVWAGSGFDPKSVHRSSFMGPVLLDGASGTVKVEGVTFHRGLSHATLSHCVVGKNALIQNVRLLNRTVVEEEAVLFDVGTITKGKSDTFANGLEVLVAVETGGREVPLYAELTVDGADLLSRSRADKTLLAGYQKRLGSYLKSVTFPFNVIGKGARVLHTPRLQDLFLGAAAVIDSAQQVEDVTVLSNAEEATEISQGAIVKSSILQWGSEVTSGALVDSSLLTEHSHVERKGLVTHAILGPNTGVAEGEVTSALLGPFVGFHHQSLLIAVLWPEGKGNVGYGANIGSNHTAKAPDQEIWPGEGTFFGLGVNIKFPSDLTGSPYTIIASGVSMLPQKVEFPFSLINTPAVTLPKISPAYNEIMPGWVLSDNIYMVKRNEGKYQKRNKARRSQFVFEVFRPEIVELMKDARKRLEVKETQEVYTGKQISGLGKNTMSERSRQKGIETYTFYIGYYALLGLKRHLEALVQKGEVSQIPGLVERKSDCVRWEHERKILVEEFAGKDLKTLLMDLVERQEKIADQVQSSKEKDDRRGAEVISDYSEAHPPASEDSFVRETRKATETLKQEVQRLEGVIQDLSAVNQ